MRLTNDWFTVVAEDPDGKTAYINGRKNLKDFIASGKFKFRIEIKYPFESETGVPNDQDAMLIEAVDDILPKVMEKDKMAILTANHLYANAKYWVFYSRTDQVFFDRLNTALQELPILPLEFTLERDPAWEEYLDMCTMEQEEPNEFV